MYVEIDFNLLYQLEKLAARMGRSVTEVVNEAVEQYLDQPPVEDDATKAAADDAS